MAPNLTPQNFRLSLLISALLFIIMIMSALFLPQWWGPRSVSVLLAVGVAGVFVTVLEIIEDENKRHEWLGPAIWILVTVVFALIFRGPSESPRYLLNLNAFTWTQNHTKAALALVALLLFAFLLFRLERALARGQRVAISSHWGGLGGGIGGWQVSGPMVYLLGIILLLTISAAVAWRILVPPPTPEQKQTDPTSTAAASSPANTQSPIGTPSASPGRTP